MTTEGSIRVEVLVRQGCHLCADALAVAAAVCDPMGVTWRAVDVDSDPLLRAQHSDHVPVTLVDGAQLSIWFLEADRLRAALTR